MERHVKERLVGAAVLVAVAVILIPELLSGPSSDHKPAPETSRNEQGIKTYQFDLNRPPSGSGQFTSSSAAPPPEQALPQPQLEPTPATEVATAAPPAEAQAAIQRSARPAVEEPAPAERVDVQQSPEPVRPQPPPKQEAAPTPKPPATSAPQTASAKAPGWAVQLGSFADVQRANQLAERLRAAGHDAYLVPLRRADGKTLQRVRIGPYEQRAAAEAALRRVAAEAKGAAVVSQP